MSYTFHCVAGISKLYTVVSVGDYLALYDSLIIVVPALTESVERGFIILNAMAENENISSTNIFYLFPEIIVAMISEERTSF